MSDYRRFISYLYEYRQGTKAENRGFVRVESRNGSCTLEIHMKLPALSAGVQLSTYGFVRQKSSLAGILFHQSLTGNGFFDARFTTDAQHMGQSQYALDQLGGLVIFSPSGHCYGTAWDESPIQVDQFTLPQPSVPASQPQVEAPLAAATASLPPESSGEESPVPVSEEESPEQKFVPEPEEEPIAQAFVPEPEEEPVAQAFVPEPEEEPVAQAFVPEPGEESLPSAQQDISRISPESGATSAKIPGPRDWCADPRWFQVQKRYPSLHPFSDETICDCVKLELKDLPALRRDGWMIGSNRFVLHGYYSHRHLLMGRLCGPEGCCYILGIPGFYDRQEQFMANTFGFPCFHAAALQNISGRTFGYWYRPIS